MAYLNVLESAFLIMLFQYFGEIKSYKAEILINGVCKVTL